MKVLGIIPARYASTRLPGKPLIDLGGKPMIQHVYERALDSVDKLVVATDDNRIMDAVRQFGGSAMMTSTHHPNGTSRCAEVVTTLNAQGQIFDVVVNIQGDEPLLDPDLPKALVQLFQNPDTQIATAIRPVPPSDELEEGRVYVVTGAGQRALYFSRSIIPHQRDVPPDRWAQTYQYYHHLGIYAFRSTLLPVIASLPVSPLEEAEKLEQLRWLSAGYSVYCVETPFESIPVDTPDDAQRVRNLLS